MGKQDEVDFQLARRYAWTLTPGHEPVLLEDATIPSLPPDREPGAAEPQGGREPAELKAISDEVDGGDLEHWRAAAVTACQALAERTEKVWALPAPEQPEAAVELLTHAGSLGFSLTALVRHPRAAARLVRLLLRYRDRLQPESLDPLSTATLWLRFEHPETGELLIDVARSGDSWLAARLNLPLISAQEEQGERPFADYPGFVPRLVEILTTSTSWSAREIAVTWLDLCCSRIAIPALRQALRLPHLGIRWRALDILLDKFTPPAVEADDILFLLQDLFVHPPPSHSSELYEEMSLYGQALERAIRSVRPPGSAELLVRIVRGKEVPRQLSRSDFDAAWALRALAAAYPEEALEHIDHALGADAWGRYAAVRAVGRLPDELARPRLLRAAADGASQVSECARELWLERFGSPCPKEPLAGIELELLSAPPSEKMLSRLLVLRGQSPEARQAMLEVLLGEAPDPEALALITFALADDTLLAQRQRRRLPKDLDQMVARLYRRFGSSAVRALCLLAARYPGACAMSWLRRLNGLVQARKLRKRDLPALRELAVRQLDSGVRYAAPAALSVLASIGAPIGLRDRLLALLLTGTDGWAWATDILAKWRRDPELDARLTAAVAAAWAQRDVTRAARVCHVGFKRRVPALLDLAQEVLTTWLAVETEGRWPDGGEAGSRRATATFALSCLELLLESGRLPASWLQTALAEPESPAFVLAARQVRRDSLAEALPALLAALGSPARGYESAAEAATTLVRLEGLAPSDPRLPPLIASAPREQRMFLLFLLVYLKAPPEPLRPLISELLATAEADEVEHVSHYVPTLCQALDPTETAALLPAVRQLSLREQIELYVQRRERQPSYWQDSVDGID